MEQKKLDRINELAAKAKTIGLTDEEIAERQQLRNEYRASIISNLNSSLDNCYVLDDNGNKVPVKRRND
ncbi:MAG: DUF896 domain-containing protein [Oscillospiraceae bacterium]|nr:DUF896 domain-containing protein [Oscillospiraceae bacterium]